MMYYINNTRFLLKYKYLLNIYSRQELISQHKTRAIMTTKFDRDLTNISLQLLEYFRALSWESSFNVLKYHQNIARCYIRDAQIDSRGLLIYHDMGLGKSPLAAAIAVDEVDEDQDGRRAIIIIVAKSLRENMRGAIIKYIKMRAEAEPDWWLGKYSDVDLNGWIDRKFSFVSLNAGNMSKQVERASERTYETARERTDKNTLDSKFAAVVKTGTLDNKLIIMDEAHNFFRAVVNGSKNALALYHMMMSARNLKILYLTGTPISNNLFEMVPCFNTLGTAEPGRVLFPEDYREFCNLFIRDGKLTNREKFMNRIQGLVSYVGHASKPGAGIDRTETGTRASFPRELPTKMIYCPMTTEQYVAYGLARDREDEESKSRSGMKQAAIMTKPRAMGSSTYHVKTRQIGNNYVGADGSGVSPKFDKLIANIDAMGNTLGIVYSQFVGNGGLGALARALESRGWEMVSLGPTKEQLDSVLAEVSRVEENAIITVAEGEEDLAEDDMIEVPESTGVAATGGRQLFASTVAYGSGIPSTDDFLSGIIESIADNPGPFIDGSAEALSHARAIGGALAITDDEIKAMSVIDVFGDAIAGDTIAGEVFTGGAHKRFALYTGMVESEDKQKLKDLFNDANNAHGGMLDLLLISSSGAEGLDLKRTRHVHILEPYFTFGRIAQIKFRAIRNDSHVDLPADEQNVQTFIYFAVVPDFPVDTTDAIDFKEDKVSARDQKTMKLGFKMTTDMELYLEAVREYGNIETGLEVMRESAIECTVNGEPNCRVCAPTSRPLYTDNIQRDMTVQDPCVPVERKKIVAETVVVDGIEYKYTPDTSSVYDFAIYEFSREINGYRTLKETDSRFATIITAVDAIVNPTQ